MKKHRCFSRFHFWQCAVFLKQTNKQRIEKRCSFPWFILCLPYSTWGSKCGSGGTACRTKLCLPSVLGTKHCLRGSVQICVVLKPSEKRLQKRFLGTFAAVVSKQTSSCNSMEYTMVCAASVPLTAPWAVLGVESTVCFLWGAPCGSCAPHCPPETSRNLQKPPSKALTVWGSCFLFSFFPFNNDHNICNCLWRIRSFHGSEHMQYLVWLISADITVYVCECVSPFFFFNMVH